MNSDKKYIWDEDNKTNNKWDGFFNSVYIISKFFDNFKIIEKSSEAKWLFWYTSKYSKTFKEIDEYIRQMLLEQKQKFLRSQWNIIIEKLYEKNLIPVFGSSDFDKLKKENYEEVIKTIYIFDPQLFEWWWNYIQKKTILSFLKSMLDWNRSDLLEIVSKLLELDEEELNEFRNVLNNTKIQNLNKLVNFLLDRKKTYLLLKKLVNEYKKETTERDHIQKIIEKNYWLFWEQYNLVSADQNFNTLKAKYCEVLEKENHWWVDGNLKRPDIFIVRTRKIQWHNAQYSINEHIIVELKRPSQSIGIDQYRQIEDYMRIISKDQTFSWRLDQWKFYVVGNELSDDLDWERNDSIDQGDPFLVKSSKSKFRIYALTRHELFSVFENNHNNYLECLELDDENLLESVMVDSADNITKNIT